MKYLNKELTDMSDAELRALFNNLNKMQDFADTKRRNLPERNRQPGNAPPDAVNPYFRSLKDAVDLELKIRQKSD